MREILFRGFHPDENGSQKVFVDGKWIKGFWVYGYLYITNDGVYEISSYCVSLNIERYTYDVIPSTVGEFTGLTDDKNDTNLFEGDIVKTKIKGYQTICIVAWAYNVSQFQLWQVDTVPGTSTNIDLGNYDCEVIGNIYENPELQEAHHD